MKQISILLKLLFVVVFFMATNMAKAQVYCAPSFVNGCFSWNNQTISVGTITWAAATTTACTLWDFTTMSTVIAPGATVPMTVTNASYCGCSVWVDFNSDGDFDDIGENLYSQYTALSSNIYNFSISIPAATPVGLYRMRVIASWGSDGVTVSPNGYGGCGAYQYGNYDDFTLNIGGVAPCVAPSGITASLITTNSATLNWSAVPGATGYEYILNNTASNPTGAGTATTLTTYNASGLTPGTAYYMHVRTNCGSGSFSPWGTGQFLTLAPCAAPTGLNASSITTNSALLSWSSLSTTSGFEYVVNTTAANPTGSGTPILTTSYNATGLTPATVYYLHVRTNCGSGNYSPWATLPFTTLSVCAATSGIVANNITNNSADLSWTAVTGAAGYQYVLDNSAGNPSGAGTPVTGTSYNATGLTAATIYYFHVRTNCGSSNFSTWVTIPFTTLAPCTAPSSLQANGITSTGATLSWAPVTGVTAYEYAVSTSATPPASGIPTATTNYIATGLTPATIYYLHVRSYCGVSNYSLWSTISFTTKAPNGVNDINENEFQFSASPNPVNTVITLSLTNRKNNAIISLTNIDGQILTSILVNSNTVNVDMSKYASGVYFAKYKDETQTKTIKISRQ